MNFLTNKLNKIASLKSLLVFFGICLASVTTISKIASAYNITYNLDTRLSYPPSVVYDVLKALGKTGRQGYLFLHLVDYLYDVSYSIFLGMALILLVKKLFPDKKSLLNLCLIPIFAGLMDFLENISLDLLILSYPSRNNIAPTLASYFTVLKNTLLSISQLLIILGLMVVATSFLLSKFNSRKLNT